MEKSVKDFLSPVPTFCSRTRPDILRRRQAVLGYVEGPNGQRPYGIKKGRGEAIVESLKKQGFEEVDQMKVATDIGVYRKAYRFLNGEIEAHPESKEFKTYPEWAGVRALYAEGIKSWADWQAKFNPKQEPEKQPTVEIKQTTTVTLTPPPAPAPPPERKVYKASDYLSTALGLVTKLETEHVDLSTKTKELETLTTELKSAVEAHQEDIAFRDELIYLYEQEAKTATLQQIVELAKKLPEYPELYAVAQNVTRKRAKNQQTRQQLLGSLPPAYKWQNVEGRIQYSGHFLEGMLLLSDHEQQQVKTKLQDLVNDGYGHSLQTKAIYNMDQVPHTPRGASYSRASDVTRFTWSRGKDGTLTVHYVFKKSLMSRSQ